MKIAINKNYGGFKVPVIVLVEIAKRKGIKLYPYVSYGFSGKRAIDLETLVDYIKDNGDYNIVLSLNDINDVESYPPKSFGPFDFDDNRSDEDLIEILEQFKRVKPDLVKEIEIIEVNKGFRIIEEDGKENIIY